MKVTVPKEDVDDEFIEELILRIKRNLIILFDGMKSKIDYLQRYITKNIRRFSYSLDRIDLESVITEGIDNIISKETTEEYIIQIDDKKFINGVYVSVYDICKFVNYGNFDVPGTMLFSNIFDETQKNLKRIEDIYYSGGTI